MRVIVIGGGPAGMMAAWRAASLGHQVILLEKNSRLGNKLLITGGGRCNFTNAQPDTRLLAQSYASAWQALLSPFSKFSATDCLDFFSQRGMPYKIEDNLRAFPVSNQALSVWNVMTELIREAGVQVFSSSPVLEIAHQDGQILGAKTKNGLIHGDIYIVATGGNSHPETGSSGDGFVWLSRLGLRVRLPEPSLVPISVREKWIATLAGVSFGHVSLSAKVNGVLKIKREGKLLVTHVGLSGPLVLNMASDLATIRQETPSHLALELEIDLFPNDELTILEKRWVELVVTHGTKKLKNAAADWVISRLVSPLLNQAQLDGEKPLHQMTKVERSSWLLALKGWRLTFRALLDASKAVVSSGGLSVDEIDFRTMQVKRFPQLRVTGDVIDINRPSGGFSLQMCWATGWVAGEIR
jgi:predicted Rossmann fold flavoprotein